MERGTPIATPMNPGRQAVRAINHAMEPLPAPTARRSASSLDLELTEYETIE